MKLDITNAFLKLDEEAVRRSYVDRRETHGRGRNQHSMDPWRPAISTPVIPQDPRCRFTLRIGHRLTFGIAYSDFDRTHIKRTKTITCLSAGLAHEVPGERRCRLTEKVD